MKLLIPTHVRLGARYSGNPSLLGQQSGDVEVCDVHMPCGERKTGRMLNPFNQTNSPSSNNWEDLDVSSGMLAATECRQ